MPRRKTRKATPYQRKIRPAAGLHSRERKRVFLFDDFVATNNQPRIELMIGRSLKCHIRLTDEWVSHCHMRLDRQPNGHMMVVPLESTNGLYVDGVLTTEPVLLTVGMRIRIGKSLLIGTAANGRFPIEGDDADEYLCRSGELYGSNRLAASQIGRSHETIRQRRIPERFRKRNKKKRET